jgi:hypothetical protein
MTKPDYTELDAAILEAVRSASGQHEAYRVLGAENLLSTPAWDCAKRLVAGKRDRHDMPIEARSIVSRRMFAMRRAGRLYFSPTYGWSTP